MSERISVDVNKAVCGSFLFGVVIGVLVGMVSDIGEHRATQPSPWPYGQPIPAGWGVYQVTVEDGVTNMTIVRIEE